jgi:hypothetical protein
MKKKQKGTREVKIIRDKANLRTDSGAVGATEGFPQKRIKKGTFTTSQETTKTLTRKLSRT